jgi:hypothetical protein
MGLDRRIPHPCGIPHNNTGWLVPPACLRRPSPQRARPSPRMPQVNGYPFHPSEQDVIAAASLRIKSWPELRERIGVRPLTGIFCPDSRFFARAEINSHRFWSIGLVATVSRFVSRSLTEALAKIIGRIPLERLRALGDRAGTQQDHAGNHDCGGSDAAAPGADLFSLRLSNPPRAPSWL